MPDEQTNKALTRRWFEEVWNKSRDEVIDEMVAPAAVVHGLGEAGQVLPGAAGFRQFYRHFRSGFSGIHITVEQVLAEGDLTAARFTARMTHGGDGLGVKATGRQVAVGGMVFIRWKDGRIVEGWNEFDVAGLLRQITAAPAAVGPASPAPAVVGTGVKIRV